jgi:hypothetical protein
MIIRLQIKLNFLKENKKIESSPGNSTLLLFFLHNNYLVLYIHIYKL